MKFVTPLLTARKFFLTNEKQAWREFENSNTESIDDSYLGSIKNQMLNCIIREKCQWVGNGGNSD